MKAIVVCSGGLDSVAVAYSIRKDVNSMILLFFDYGQRSLVQEEACAKKCAEKLDASFVKISLPWLMNFDGSKLTTDEALPDVNLSDVKKSRASILDYWVPCRNSLFITIGLAYAESLDLKGEGVYDVYVGIKDEGDVPMKDTTPSFLEAMNTVAKEGTHHGTYKVLAPFLHDDKVTLVKKCHGLVPWEDTYSCYVGGEKHCGSCENCQLRKKGFYWANVEDPTSYAN